MTLFYEGKTFLHKLNPLTKFTAALIAILHASLLSTPAVLLVHIMLGFILVVAARPRLRPIVLAGFSAAVIGHFWVNVLLYRYNFGLNWPDSLVSASLLAARVLVIVLYSITVLATTNPRDLAVAASVHLRIPYTYSFMVFVSLRMLPLIMRDMENMAIARKIRGYISVKNPISLLATYMTPLFSLAVRRSIYMGISLESKGFGKTRARTYLNPTRFGRGDWAFLAAMSTIIFITSIISLNWTYWGV